VGAGDVVVEGVGGGVDAVYTDTDYTLSDNVEYLIGTANNGMSLTGNGGDNVIWGTSFADNLNGGVGNDWLIGGAGGDTLTGGTGADLFLLTAVGDSGSGAGLRDIVTDFLEGTDRIDFSRLDANSGIAGDQAFTFINTGAFTGVAGQLRYESVGGNTIVQGDVNGDGIADFELQLTGAHTLTVGDFLL
jgi:Ca2+-binding RTX toxin-like protein